jgi:hypothetical protein
MSREIPAIRRTDEASVVAVSSLLRPDRPGAAPSASAEELAWRRAWHAVESCRRVAELAARR